MKIYCAAPIRGNTANKEFADAVPVIISKTGHTPLTESALAPGKKLYDTEIFLRDIEWLKESSCVIAEVSCASTGVGFEIAYAVYTCKIPVLVVYKTGSSVSAMITGCNSVLIHKREYENIQQLQEHILTFIESLQV